MTLYTKLSHHVVVEKYFEVCFWLTLVKSDLRTTYLCWRRRSQAIASRGHLSNQAFTTVVETCADRRLSNQAIAKGVEVFLDRLLAKQTFGEGFEQFADNHLSNHTFIEINEVFTDGLLSNQTAQKKLMRLLTKVCQKQTFAEGF